MTATHDNLLWIDGLLTVEAAADGDRNAAYQALLTHPLGSTAAKVQEVWEDILEINQQWLPQFK